MPSGLPRGNLPLLLELFDVVQRQSHLLRKFGNQFITVVERHLELYVSAQLARFHAMLKEAIRYFLHSWGQFELLLGQFGMARFRT